MVKDKKLSRAEATGQKRLQIVEAAAACFIAKGFHQSSMRDIANVAGVSLGNLYNHFESKADLITGLAEMEAEENKGLIRILQKNGAPLEILKTFTCDYFEKVREPGHASLTAEIFSEAMRNRDINDIFDENRRNLAKSLSSCLERGQKRGDVDDILDPAATADHLLDLIEGAALRAALSGETPTELDRHILFSIVDKIVAAQNKS